MPPLKTIDARLSEVKIVGKFSCWRLPKKPHWSGYVHIWQGSHQRVAHRVIYEYLIGFVKKGLELDHLCRNRWCCNPDHLEQVTRKVNVMRGLVPGIRTTRCPQGHLYEGDNLYVRPNGHRSCRTCTRDSVRRYCAKHPKRSREAKARWRLKNRQKTIGPSQ
jgi:hypothetical protein